MGRNRSPHHPLTHGLKGCSGRWWKLGHHIWELVDTVMWRQGRSLVSWSTISGPRRLCIRLRFVLMSYLFNSYHFYIVKSKKKIDKWGLQVASSCSFQVTQDEGSGRHGTRGSEIMAGVGVPIFLSPTIGESVSILWWVHDTMLQYHNNIMSCHYTNEMEICMSCSCCIT